MATVLVAIVFLGIASFPVALVSLVEVVRADSLVRVRKFGIRLCISVGICGASLFATVRLFHKVYE